MKHYREGFSPPSTAIINKWLAEYDLSRSDFADIIEKDITWVRRLFFRNDSSQKTYLSCAETRLFLLWAGLVKLVKYKPIKSDYWSTFRHLCKKNGMLVSDVAEKLGLARARLYQIRDENPQDFINRVSSLPEFKEFNNCQP